MVLKPLPNWRPTLEGILVVVLPAACAPVLLPALHLPVHRLHPAHPAAPAVPPLSPMAKRVTGMAIAIRFASLPRVVGVGKINRAAWAAPAAQRCQHPGVLKVVVLPALHRALLPVPYPHRVAEAVLHRVRCLH